MQDNGTTDRTLILLEDIQGQVRLIAEGHDVLKDRMERLEGKFVGLEDKVDSLRSEVYFMGQHLGSRIDRNTHDIQELSKKVDGNTHNIQVLVKKVDGNTHDIRELKAAIVG